MTQPQLEHDGTLNVEITTDVTTAATETTPASTAKAKGKFVFTLGNNLDEAIAKHGAPAVYRAYLAGAHADILAEATRALRGSQRPLVEPIRPKALQAHMDGYTLGLDRLEEAKLARVRAQLESLTPAQRAAVLGS